MFASGLCIQVEQELNIQTLSKLPLRSRFMPDSRLRRSELGRAFGGLRGVRIDFGIPEKDEMSRGVQFRSWTLGITNP